MLTSPTTAFWAQNINNTRMTKRLSLLLLASALVQTLYQTLYAQVPTTGLKLWLKADDLRLANGESVSLWQDASGNAHHATSSGTARPMFLQNQLNGRPVVRFSGTTGFSNTGTAMNIALQTGSAVTAIVVAANRRSLLVREAVDVLLASKTSGDPNQFTGFGLSTYNGFVSTTAREITAEAPGQGATVRLRKNGRNAPLMLSQNEFAVITYLGAGIANRGTVNGQEAGSRVRLGSFVAEAQGLYGTNDIAEILLYDRALSQSEVIDIENYLGQKYNIATGSEPFAPVVISGKPWRGAEYRTRETFTYGRFEVRMRSVAGSGVLSSFFTYHPFTGGREQWNEIDIEILGRYSNEVQFNVITANEVSHAYRQVVNFNPHQDFHDYAFEWTPTYVAWFIDGREVYRQTGPHIQTLTRPQKIMMNIWQPIYTDWTGPFDPRILPLYPQYDNVRYYDFTPGRGSAGTDNNFSLRWVENFDEFNPERWERATHTWDANNALFVPENVFFRNGVMFLGLTLPEQAGRLLSVSRTEAPVPTGFSLSQNYPNPFNPTTTIAYQLPKPSRVSLKVYDTLGREIATLVQTRQQAGEYRVQFSAEALALPSGVYLYRLQTEEFSQTKKMILLK
ncbi:MAG: hypothetical protein CMR00_11400 [[Chlorobium] sp. 445]|nr:MAG: hypothetical protein CMR00_11400 [[Chlorobium] sp. 445]